MELAARNFRHPRDITSRRAMDSDATCANQDPPDIGKGCALIVLMLFCQLAAPVRVQPTAEDGGAVFKTGHTPAPRTTLAGQAGHCGDAVEFWRDSAPP